MEEKNLSVQQKLTKAMLDLRTLRPFYSGVYEVMEKEASTQVDSISVSLYKILYNERYIQESSYSQVLFGVLHAVAHIALRHISRREQRDSILWNDACDLYVNKLLAEEFGISTPGDTVVIDRVAITMPEWEVFDENLDLDTDFVERLYQTLLQDDENKQGKKESTSQREEEDSEDGSPSEDKKGGDTPPPEENSEDNSESSENQENPTQEESDFDENQEETEDPFDPFASKKNTEEPNPNTPNPAEQNKNNDSKSEENTENNSPDSEDSANSEPSKNQKSSQNQSNAQGQEDAQNQSSSQNQNNAQGQEDAQNQRSSPSQKNAQGQESTQNQNNSPSQKDSQGQESSQNQRSSQSQNSPEPEKNAPKQPLDMENPPNPKENPKEKQAQEGGGKGQSGSSAQSQGESSPSLGSAAGQTARKVTKKVLPKQGNAGDLVDTFEDQLEKERQSEKILKEAFTKAALNRELLELQEEKSILQREVEKSLTSHVDWRKLLRQYLRAADPSDLSFSTPDKRFFHQKMILPGAYLEDLDQISGLKICIDTSSSISAEDLSVFLGQVWTLCKQFKIGAELIYWDTFIESKANFEEFRQIQNVTVYGGGGTDPSCLFHYFESKDCAVKPLVTLIFTDGFVGNAFVTPKRVRKFKNTIWVMSENYNRSFQPAFGKIAIPKYN